MHKIMPEKPLWGTDDQSSRLAELTAGTEDRSKELPLRRDVRSLGVLLGRVLVNQSGDPLFKIVERLRRLLIESRAHSARAQSNTQEMREAQEIVKGLNVKEAYRMTKAFAIYFELTNLAETNHRKRRRRAVELHRADSQLQPGSFRSALARMRAAGITASDALHMLLRLEVIPVFTAHPTEVARRTVLFKRKHIAAELESLDRLPLTDTEAAAGAESIAAEIAALWQSDEVRRRQPTLRDEIKMGLDYYADSII